MEPRQSQKSIQRDMGVYPHRGGNRWKATVTRRTKATLFYTAPDTNASYRDDGTNPTEWGYTALLWYFAKPNRISYLPKPLFLPT